MPFDLKVIEAAVRRLEAGHSDESDDDLTALEALAAGPPPIAGVPPVPGGPNVPGGPPPAPPLAGEHVPVLDGLTLLGRYASRSRYRVGISQRTLSVRCGVSQSMIARLELGRAPGMRIDHLVPIGDELGRAFPLGFCPHEHRCIWQPIRPRPPLSDEDKRRELLVRLGLDHPYSRWGDD